jgi:hypothetical protein
LKRRQTNDEDDTAALFTAYLEVTMVSVLACSTKLSAKTAFHDDDGSGGGDDDDDDDDNDHNDRWAKGIIPSFAHLEVTMVSVLACSKKLSAKTALASAMR